MDIADRQGRAGAPIGAIRRYPYPFKAMLAICSDLDETPDRQAYWALMHFLNSRAEGALGIGLGLEVGNSIYFDMPPAQFAYWNTDECGRAMVRALIRSGHVDCLHSFGDLATSRRHAGLALDELTKHDCSLNVWVDHAVAPTNFGGDIMKGFGDVPGHPAYHADLTVPFGVRYVWRGRVTSVIGQDQPSSLRGIGGFAHPAASLKTLAKERVKRVLSHRHGSRYRLHRANRVAAQARLRDGTVTIEFLRSNPHWGGVSSAETADGIPEVLTAPFLDRLVARQASCILYTHLGKRRRDDGGGALSMEAMQSFRLLAERQSRGEVSVTTTHRLLDYTRARDEAQTSWSRSDNRVCIEVTVPDAQSAQGLTFYTDAPLFSSIRVNGTLIENITCNPPDESGRTSVTIPWRPLEFPQV